MYYEKNKQPLKFSSDTNDVLLRYRAALAQRSHYMKLLNHKKMKYKNAKLIYEQAKTDICSLSIQYDRYQFRKQLGKIQIVRSIEPDFN